MLNETTYQSARAVGGSADAELAEVFHENTKLHEWSWRRLGRRIERVLSDSTFEAASRHAFKSYPSSEAVGLPPTDPRVASFEDLVRRRRSQRSFLEVPIALSDVASMSRQAASITGYIPFEDGARQYLRTAPSGGALYPIEIYWLARAVEGLEPGWYHYDVSGERLERVNDFDGPTAERAIGPVAKEAAAAVILTAILPRTLYKYGSRGYRFALIEAGHVAAHIYLAATALNIAAVALGSYLDDEVASCLAVDGSSEVPVYAAVFGVGDPEEELCLP
jgi:SagB-type dehydrogenase family enzyme